VSVKSRTRRPVARHGQLHRPSAWTQLLKIIGIAVTVVLVSGVSVAAYVVYDLSTDFTEGAVVLAGQDDVPPDIGDLKGGVNMLLVGSDECEEGYEASFGDRCTEDDGGARNDVNMLLHISDEPRRVTVITFPRDLMVEVPDCTDADGGTVSGAWSAQINTVYERGGLGCVVDTVAELSGQEIQFAAKITWDGVIQITNAIGGVDVCIATRLEDEYYTGLVLEPGMHSLAGWDALQFLRTRHGVGDGSDLARVSNQQVYMSSLARKLVSEEVLTNVGTLLRLAKVTLSNVTPSQSLTNPMLLAQIAMAVKNVPFEDINFLQYPVFDDPDNVGRVIPDYASADQLWAVLAANESMQVTGGTDAVTADGAEIPAATAEPTPEDGETVDAATPTPTGPVGLPSNIKGQSAATQSCANGAG